MIRKFGLIGRSLKHSFSQKYFTEKFNQEHIHAIYGNYELQSIDEIIDIIRKEPTLCGFNVTIPYKQGILSYLDIISPEAQIIGAVNCVKIVREAERLFLHGYNTDYIGFQHSLQHFLNGVIPSIAYILGTGGASKAIAYVLQQLNIPFYVISRHPQLQQMSYEALNNQISRVHSLSDTLIINCTPLGTWPNCDEAPPIHYHQMNNHFYLFDLVYNPPTTQFMQQGALYGAHAINGLEMLIGQAEEAWNLWNR